MTTVNVGSGLHACAQILQLCVNHWERLRVLPPVALPPALDLGRAARAKQRRAERDSLSTAQDRQQVLALSTDERGGAGWGLLLSGLLLCVHCA